jgi:hypothetical protein
MLPRWRSALKDAVRFLLLCGAASGLNASEDVEAGGIVLRAPTTSRAQPIFFRVSLRALCRVGPAQDLNSWGETDEGDQSSVRSFLDCSLFRLQK